MFFTFLLVVYVCYWPAWDCCLVDKVGIIFETTGRPIYFTLSILEFLCAFMLKMQC